MKKVTVFGNVSRRSNWSISAERAVTLRFSALLRGASKGDPGLAAPRVHT